jgi:metal-responsive CopG/Arc/MetJ family transcriptional regulator
MKTAISLPDPLFRSADVLADRLGISRSQLYATALAEYLAKHQTRKVTERLDEVYAAEPGRLEPGLAAAQTRTVRRNEW